jgi:signal transduction histidine kinase
MSDDHSVLVVDDDQTNRYFKTHVLSGAGYSVSEAARGGEALDQVHAAPPALVLLDVKLPDMSGIDVCKRLKADNPGVLVVQTSAAFIASDDRTRALSGGADLYLVEPIEPEELVATVGAMFRLRRAESELRRQNERLEVKVAERVHELADVNRRLTEESRHRAQTEEALRHAQKLDALGQLTGGIAHDFNNLLTVISGNLEMVERGIRAWDPAKRDKILLSASLALRATRDCGTLTHKILAFARRDALRLTPVAANTAIQHFLPLLRRAGEGINLKLSLGSNLWTCRVDVGQLEAAILNLVVNARDAMPSGGTVEIETANMTVDAARPPYPADLEPGDYVRITVADSGIGMTPDVANRAFEPFFTTKDVGKGSGLGLSQVYGFAKQAGGSVSVQTAPGAGTRVMLHFPRTLEDPAALEHGTAPAEAPGGSETILAVEDNELVRAFVVQALQDLGYGVIAASSGREAMGILKSGAAMALLFTDVVMPKGMSGIELANEAMQLRPGLKVLLTSGFAAHPAGEQAATEFPCLAKPYSIAELAVCLRAVLDD